MIEIIKDRGEGKTQALIELSEKEQIPIVVSTFNELNHLVKEAYRQNRNIPQPLTTDGFGYSFKGRCIKFVLIDNIERFKNISHFADMGITIKGYTANTGSVAMLVLQNDKLKKTVKELETQIEELKEYKEKYDALFGGEQK